MDLPTIVDPGRQYELELGLGWVKAMKNGRRKRHIIVNIKIKIRIELKNDFLILSLDRLGGTHEGGQDADVITSGWS